MTRAETAELLSLLVECYPRRMVVTDRTLDLWHGMLGEYPVEAVLEKAHHHVKRSKWPPTIAEVNPEVMLGARAWMALTEPYRREEEERKTLAKAEADRWMNCPACDGAARIRGRGCQRCDGTGCVPSLRLLEA